MEAARPRSLAAQSLNHSVSFDTRPSQVNHVAIAFTFFKEEPTEFVHVHPLSLSGVKDVTVNNWRKRRGGGLLRERKALAKSTLLHDKGQEEPSKKSVLG